MAFIEYVVIHIDGKKFELSKEHVRELYNELRELLHEKVYPPVSCPSVWSGKYVPPPHELTVSPYRLGDVTNPFYWYTD